MRLTDTALRNAAPSDKPYKLFDGGGLYALITPSGGRLWRLKYRYLKREKLLSLGRYPTVTLKRARMLREEAKVRLADGIDPSAERQAMLRSLELNSGETFEKVATEYFDKLIKEGRAPRTLKKNNWLISLASKSLATRPISDITSPEVLKVLREIEGSGRYETARRLRTLLSAIFRYGIATAKLKSDPTYALKGALIAPTVVNRAAVTTKKDLSEVLMAVDAFEGEPTTKSALKLLILLSPRPGELRFAKWSEFDMEEKVWRIPADRTKMRREHRVPLCRQAIKILNQQKRISGNSEYVFPSVRSVEKPISEGTLNKALRSKGFKNHTLTPHGFRATFSTLANESGLWNADAIERALGHIENNDVRRAYLRGEHWEERKRLSDWWGNLVDTLRLDAK